jgi:type II secretory pathway pseudopilin PulG
MKTWERGQSLFELVVAIAISALIIVAMVSLAVNSIQNSSFSKNKARAATYAQEATEWLRGQRDTNTDAFIIHITNLGGNKMCLNSLSWTVGTCGTVKITDTPFQRDVVFSFGPDAETVIAADITVSWTDAAGLHQVTSATNFSDWRQR